jgi:hypothetical protein
MELFGYDGKQLRPTDPGKFTKQCADTSAV